MAELRVRSMDDDVRATLKSEAAKQKTTYADYVKEVLAEKARELEVQKV